tara:strand:- start:461 stop:1891 length:1431 start_codon:yes stop_codon:yes gene_type:complete
MACPIDSRYYGTNPTFLKRLKPYVSEEGYVRYQARVEVALAQVLVERKLAPPALAEELEKASHAIRVEDVYAEEQRIGHNIRALVNCLKKHVSKRVQPFIHLCATSNDITDTAMALRLKELTRDILLPDLIQLEKTLLSLARHHAETIQMGRTHGQHATPITFGYAMANYVARVGNRIEQIENARVNLRGQLSGAVGAYNALSLLVPDNTVGFECDVLAKLGLRPIDTQVSTQIIHPEYVTDLVHAVTSAFSVLANIADDIRQLHRSEIGEVHERYDTERVGSSTMPHKRNPSNFEFVKSMWKAMMPRMMTLYMDQISEHQRDLTNSASARFITELFTAFIYASYRLTDALKRLEVDKDAMSVQLKGTAFEAILAEPLYILLTAHGHPDGYGGARTVVDQARATGEPISKLMWEDETLAPYLNNLSAEQRDLFKNPQQYIGAAVQQTHVTCDEWDTRCARLTQQLNDESTAQHSNR